MAGVSSQGLNRAPVTLKCQVPPKLWYMFCFLNILWGCFVFFFLGGGGNFGELFVLLW